MDIHDIHSDNPTSGDELVTLNGMYKEYFLDYASYVILERAVPDIDDGLKPVQRRILHAMKEMDDGRYHKVANIIGQTMQYHQDLGFESRITRFGSSTEVYRS